MKFSRQPNFWNSASNFEKVDFIRQSRSSPVGPALAPSLKLSFHFNFVLMLDLLLIELEEELFVSNIRWNLLTMKWRGKYKLVLRIL